MGTLAFMFPGQGSQYIGMGKDLHETFPYAREIFEKTDEAAGKKISTLCFEGPEEELTQTVNQQPAITAVNLCCLEYLKRESLLPALACGHSLGEFSALHAAGILGLDDTIRLVVRRAQLMQREAERRPGAMSAVIGLGAEVLDRFVERASSKYLVGIANHNSAEQLVISGEAAGVETVGEEAAAEGARVVPLPVSGAWHSELMRDAVEDFQRTVADATVNRPELSVLFNVTAAEESDPAAIRELMVRQLVSPVRWFETMERLVEAGVDTFVEVGPKNVLKGLLRRFHPDRKAVRMANVENVKGLEAFVEKQRSAGE